MNKDEAIRLIAARISDEQRKHPNLDYCRIAAGKIYEEWIQESGSDAIAFADFVEKTQARYMYTTAELYANFKEEVTKAERH